jgi:ATP-dependent Clp protease protease subunit
MAVANARVLVHQPSSGGIQGQVSDLELHAAEMTRLRALMETTLAHHTGRSAEQIHTDVERDLILDAQQAMDYGIVDSIIQSRKLSAVR